MGLPACPLGCRNFLNLSIGNLPFHCYLFLIRKIGIKQNKNLKNKLITYSNHHGMDQVEIEDSQSAECIFGSTTLNARLVCEIPNITIFNLRHHPHRHHHLLHIRSTSGHKKHIIHNSPPIPNETPSAEQTTKQPPTSFRNKNTPKPTPNRTNCFSLPFPFLYCT